MNTIKNVKQSMTVLSSDEKQLLLGGKDYYIGKRKVTKEEYKEFAECHTGKKSTH